MIDLTIEEGLPLKQAAQLFPTTPSVKTLINWHRRGFRGVRLECRPCGRSYITSREAVLRFLDALSARP